ncbi:DUF1648 domain-containing protein [Aquimarina sp. W85]|uniref:DUF1648 domain-containing protein n=1 Tax=Aquimarina rhodophyticola TaxID=3342246 RepID=UPI0036722604
MTEKQNLKLLVPSKNIDKILEILSLLVLLIIWVVPLIFYIDLPETIPIHYNSAGKVDEFGHKRNIFLGPSLALLLYIGVMLLSKKLHLFNKTPTYEKKDVLKDYTIAIRLIRVIQLIVEVVLALVVLRTLQSAMGVFKDLGVWFLPVVLGLLFITLAYFLIKSIKVIR